MDATAQRVAIEVVGDDIEMPAGVTIRRMDTVTAKKKKSEYGVVLDSDWCTHVTRTV